MFLIPFDLSALKPNHKTFLRQKTYHLPSLERSNEKNHFGKPAMKTTNSSSSSSAKKNGVLSSGGLHVTKDTLPPAGSLLKSAIHLQFIRSSKGKLFLTKSIRLVFSPPSQETSGHLFSVVLDGPYQPINKHNSTILQGEVRKKQEEIDGDLNQATTIDNDEGLMMMIRSGNSNNDTHLHDDIEMSTTITAAR